MNCVSKDQLWADSQLISSRFCQCITSGKKGILWPTQKSIWGKVLPHFEDVTTTFDFKSTTPLGRYGLLLADLFKLPAWAYNSATKVGVILVLMELSLQFEDLA